MSLIGHSHVALFFAMAERPAPRRSRRDRRRRRGAQAGDGTRLDLAEGRWLINPGSVGQPRDGDPARRLARARHRGSGQATYHRVDYDIDRAAEAIAATGLPEHLAERLYVGQ